MSFTIGHHISRCTITFRCTSGRCCIGLNYGSKKQSFVSYLMECEVSRLITVPGCGIYCVRKMHWGFCSGSLGDWSSMANQKVIPTIFCSLVRDWSAWIYVCINVHKPRTRANRIGPILDSVDCIKCRTKPITSSRSECAFPAPQPKTPEYNWQTDNAINCI